MCTAYIAAPFFNETQLAIVEQIKTTIAPYIEYYSPKDECLFVQGMDPAAVLDVNCKNIRAADFIIAVTDGKDVGTIWECGYAYACNVPILYIWLGWQPEMKFNIMLAASGTVVHSYDMLESCVRFYAKHDKLPELDQNGMLYE